ncbi:MAG: hypothetical protein KUG72_06020 [Pseudomonadales bacterium]|nr:hypothetical protein [Pseudomonadales bacterium]
MKKILIAIILLVVFFVWSGVGKVLVRKWIDERENTTATQVQKHVQRSDYLFQSEECGYRVKLPRQPNIKKLHTAKAKFFQQALVVEDKYMIRASCQVFEGATTFENASQNALIENAQNFAKKEGLSDALVEYSESELGKVLVLTGYKQVQSMDWRMKYVFYYRGLVRFSVVVGGLASGYPQSGVLEAYKSVQLMP